MPRASRSTTSSQMHVSARSMAALNASSFCRTLELSALPARAATASASASRPSPSTRDRAPSTFSPERGGHLPEHFSVEGRERLQSAEGAEGSHGPPSNMGRSVIGAGARARALNSVAHTHDVERLDHRGDEGAIGREAGRRSVDLPRSQPCTACSSCATRATSRYRSRIPPGSSPRSSDA
jgi:hypothetical protein